MNRAQALAPAAELPSEDAFAVLFADERGFELLAELLQRLSGIHYNKTPKNLSLMASRLVSVLREQNLAGYQDLYDQIKSGDERLQKRFISALTTNTTNWFREPEHFAMIKDLAQKQVWAQRSETLRVWCAAASSGQEAYGLSITLAEAGVRDYRILATDIDEQILRKAAAGCYLPAEMSGLSDKQRDQYFEEKKSSKGKYFRIDAKIAQPVTFAPLNLLDSRYPFQKSFDMIMCRNVFIYFQREVTAEIVERMAHFQKPGSWLFLGHAEAATMRSSKYKSIQHAVYERLEK